MTGRRGERLDDTHEPGTGIAEAPTAERRPVGHEWAEPVPEEWGGSSRQPTVPRWVARVARLRERGLLD